MILLIPGPVTTRPEVRAAAALDYAPWDLAFRPRFADVLTRLGTLAGADQDRHAVLPLQGCGHFVVEAAVRSLVPADGAMLVPMTGAYATRMVRLARDLGRTVVELAVSQTVPVAPAEVCGALAAHPNVTHLGLVQSETSSGIVNDVSAIGAVVAAAGRRLIVDAISAFGALPLDLQAQSAVDAVVFSVNKCLEGLPGLAVAIVRIDALHPGQARSWCFDLADLFAHYRRSPGSSRFTPSPQAIIALERALEFLAAEGGPVARLARYTANRDTLYDGATRLGLTPCLPRAQQGPIVMNIRAPVHPAWNLQIFVDALKEEGFLISNFYDTQEPSFRVGCIGAIGPDEMRGFVAAMDRVLDRLGLRPALQGAA